MIQVLQVGNQTITPEEVFPLLARYRMLPQLWREIIIDQAIAPFTGTTEEQVRACQQFYQQHRLTSEAECQAWLQRQGMTLEQLNALAIREFTVEKFKRATWGHKLESYFLQRKQGLDKVVYSLLRTKDIGVAQELYFRIREGEQSFAELAREYSLGSESQTGGTIGPMELSNSHPTLARLLSASQPGQLWSPVRVEEWFAIIRLERFIPAQLDEPMRQRLLNDLFALWLQEQLRQVRVEHEQIAEATLAS